MAEPERRRSEVGHIPRSRAAGELAAATKDEVLAATAAKREAESAVRDAEATGQRAEAALQRSEARLQRAKAALERSEATRRRAEAGLGRSGAMARRAKASHGAIGTRGAEADERDRVADAREAEADERDRVADAREAEADERDRVADAREAEADAQLSNARAMVEVARHAERLAGLADTIALYFREHAGDRGDADRRLAFAAVEQEIAAVLHRNAGRLRAGGRPQLEHLPELPAIPPAEGD